MRRYLVDYGYLKRDKYGENIIELRWKVLWKM
ncbi:hypothetical protein [Clostridium sartagoforme]|nr:hypothetical protein [Clostridium sartagoforme]